MLQVSSVKQAGERGLAMGFFDDVQEALGQGVSAAKGAVSGVAVEQQAFVKGFARLCADGWSQGWHERNGGNASYRLSLEDVASSRPFFYDHPSSWMSLDEAAENLRGEYILITAAGAYLRNVALDPDVGAGIVEINATGRAWRIVWGFKGGGMPTSELASHVAIQSVRKEVFKDESRVLYHAHPANVVALTNVLPLDERTFTRTLWKMLLESMIAFPKGVGVVPWMVPGGAQIAQATASVMRAYDACIWAHHGLFCAGVDFDAAFGLAQAIDKAAAIYISARAMNGGRDDFLNEIPDEGLRDIAQAYHLPVNEKFL